MQNVGIGFLVLFFMVFAIWTWYILFDSLANSKKYPLSTTQFRYGKLPIFDTPEFINDWQIIQ